MSVLTHSSSVVHRTIVVGLLNDEPNLGALAYALDRALLEQRRVRVVRPVDDRVDSPCFAPIPLDVIEVGGDAAAVLLEETHRASALVVQSPPDEAGALVDPILSRLRRETHCVLIEVDQDGEVVRACGPSNEGDGFDEFTEPLVSAPRALGDLTVGIDGTAAGLAALEWALSNAAVGQGVRLVAGYATTSGESIEAARRRAENHVAAAKLFARRAGDWRAPVVTARLEKGETFDVLLNNARDSALLVLGRHGTSGMIHNTLASVGDSCARLATCPVVVVPPVSAQMGIHQFR